MNVFHLHVDLEIAVTQTDPLNVPVHAEKSGSSAKVSSLPTLSLQAGQAAPKTYRLTERPTDQPIDIREMNDHQS